MFSIVVFYFLFVYILSPLLALKLKINPSVQVAKPKRLLRSFAPSGFLKNKDAPLFKVLV
jgi:hypothetical protein